VSTVDAAAHKPALNVVRELRPHIVMMLACVVGAGCLAAGCSAASENGPLPSSSTVADPAGPATAASDGSELGAGSEPRSPLATAALASTGPHLAVVLDHPGSCTAPTCGDLLGLLPDGGWTYTPAGGETTSGTFDPGALSTLAAAADPGAVALGPFAGECPTVVGGQERFYRVFAPGDPDRIVLDVSSCRHQLDAGAPLLVALDLLMAEARSSGTAQS
jgi:hypothetical protein